jgi:MFS family permease
VNAAVPPSTALKQPGPAVNGQGDFWKLWLGQTATLAGDSFMIVALPLFAVTVLHVSVAQAALLPFALTLPFLVLSLPAGALLDRLPRRAVMLICDAVQVCAFGAIALLAWWHALAFPVLMVLLVASGSAAIFSQVACTTYLPSLIDDPDHLHRGNARLYLSESLSKTLGPVAAGPLVGLLGPIVAIAANAGTFLVSLLSLAWISRREPPLESRAKKRGWLLGDIREGLRYVVRHPVLEPVLTSGTIYIFFLSVLEASLVLYLKYDFGMSTIEIGLVLGLVGVSAPVGNLLSKRISDWLGMPRAMVLSVIVNVAGTAAMPLSGSLGWTVGLIAGGVLQGFGNAVFSPISLTLRQTLTPPQLLGRVNSVQRFMLWGMIPLGSLAASGIISLTNLATALWIGGVGTVLCLPGLVRRGIRRGWARPFEALS